MGLSGRVAALERKLAIRGGRRYCRCKDSRPKVRVYRGDEPPAVEESSCARCGGIVESIIIHVRHKKPEPLPDANGTRHAASPGSIGRRRTPRPDP